MGLAQEICRIARQEVGDEVCPHVVAVGLEVGDASGVEPDQLIFWLDILLREPPFDGARPVIDRTEGDTFRVTYLEVDDGDTKD